MSSARALGVPCATVTHGDSAASTSGFFASGSAKDFGFSKGFVRLNRKDQILTWRRPVSAVLLRNPPAGSTESVSNSSNGSVRTAAGGNESRRAGANGVAISSAKDDSLNYRRTGESVVTRPETKLININADSPIQREAEARAGLRAMDVKEYDYRILFQRYSKAPFQVIKRTLNISITLGGFAFSLFLDSRRGRIEKNMRMRARQLRRKLTDLGPTFVKIGQGLSTRPDLCPPEYLEELAELQDALPCFPDADAFACIEKELGAPLESFYSFITSKPIAAASLGQVYKARLRSTGDLVAVKVQRPFIEDAVGLDFYLLRGLCGLIDKYVDIITSDVVALLDEFARRVYQELNYVQEARNAVRFGKLYGDKTDVLVPGIYWDYVSAKVLTMQWVDGTKLSDLQVIEEQGLDILQLVDIGIQCSLRQLLEYGYFHADPHPGNLLATADGKLAFLDFGMMSETPELARFAIIGHVVHLVNRDYEAMARDYYALDFLEPDVDVGPIVPALKNFFDDVLNATVSELNFKTIVDGLGAVLYRYPFNVPAYYALILRSLTVLEGLALYTDPNFKVLAASYPYFAKRLLTDRNPYLRDSLIELLFKDGRFRWNRLENLLVQGSKDRDYNAAEVMQPVLNLLLGEGGEELRRLVEKEAVKVAEALVVGSAIAGYRSVPQPFRSLLGANFVKLRDSDEDSILGLREQVLRVWGMLRGSSGFNPASLQPIVEVLQIPEAQAMGGRVAGGITRRLAARALQQLLRRPQTSAPSVP